jgi:predicted HicB family RNase H-like nuclease
MSDENGNGARMTTRLPRRLLEAAKRVAKRERRSLNAFVVTVVEQAVREREEGRVGDA